MRNMSFFLTTHQFLDGRKTVTRRLGWKTLRVGDLVRAVYKGQGIRMGSIISPIGIIRIKSIRSEPLNVIPADDCAREGFPKYSPQEFVTMFCREMRCAPDVIVQRIEFERLRVRDEIVGYNEYDRTYQQVLAI